MGIARCKIVIVDKSGGRGGVKTAAIILAINCLVIGDRSKWQSDRPSL